MSPLLIAALCAIMVATSFLSGLFGMAGGLILVGVLLAFMPLPAAMVLHAVTQMASNGWRALLWRRYVQWRAVAVYVLGCGVAAVVWAFWLYVPSKPIAMLFLGVTPFLVRLVPAGLRPNPESIVQGTLCGSICMTLLLLTGVAGPLIDTYFLGGGLDRRRMVATKAVCQIFGHALKLAYFGGLVDQAASLDPVLAVLAIVSSMLGTTLARPILEMMTDGHYRVWVNRLINATAGYFIAYGAYLLAVA